jgi:hypothetical protein
MTELACQGRLDPIRGRDAEIRQIIDVLLRRRQNNPILTGEAGVGEKAHPRERGRHHRLHLLVLSQVTLQLPAVAHRADSAGLELLIARAYQAEERVETHGDEVAAVLYEPDRVEPGGEHYLIAITAMELDLFQRVLIERAERVGRRVAGAKELVNDLAEIGQRKWLEERGEGPLDSRLECSALHWHARVVAIASVAMMPLNHDALCRDGLCMVRAPQCDRLTDRLRTSGTLLSEPLHRRWTTAEEGREKDFGKGV